jgi:PAS domain S-box-containing protein
MTTPNPIRVMLVDDHIVLHRRLALFLEDFDDLELVGEIANGANALQVCSEVSPDVVLVALTTPVANGVEVVSALHRTWPQAQIVVLTSPDGENLIDAALEAGAVHHLPKDAPADALVNAIRALFSTRVIQEAIAHDEGHTETQSKTEETPRKSKDFLQATLDALPFHTIILDKLGKIIATNETWYRCANAHNFLGATWDEGTNYLTCCDDAVGEWSGMTPLVAQGIREIIAGVRKDFRIEYPCHGKDEGRWFMLHAVRFEDGGAPRVVVVQEDISKRKQAEEVLVRTASIDAIVAELSGALMSLTSVDDISSLVLEQAMRFTDSAFGSVGCIDPATGELICLILPAEARNTHPNTRENLILEKFEQLHAWMQANQKSLVANTPAQMPWQSGEQPDDIPSHRLLASPAVDNDRLIGLVALANFERDYTDQDLMLAERLVALYALAIERKRADNALRESETKIRAIVSSSPDSIIVTGLDGHILSCNQATLDLHGYSSQAELASLNVLELIAPQDRQRVRENIEQLFEQGTLKNVEYALLNKAGQVFSGIVSANVILNPAGEPTSVVAVTKDITERKRSEDALRQYADRQAALYAVTSAVATSLDPAQLCSTVLDTLLAVLDADAGWVVSSLTQDGPLQAIAWRGMSKPFLPALLGHHPACTLLTADNDQGEIELVRECKSWLPEVARADSFGHVCVPLRAAGKVQGVLALVWHNADRQGRVDRSLLAIVSQQVGIALYNAQLYQTARQVTHLQALNDLNRMLAATMDPETIVETTLRHIKFAVDAPLGILIELSTHKDTYRLFTLENGWNVIDAPTEQQQSLAPFLAHAQENFETGSIAGEELVAAGCPDDITARWGASGLTVFVWNDADTTLLLALGGRPSNSPFSDSDRALVQAATSAAHQALQNANLYKASREQSARLATINAISAAAVASLDVNTVLRQVLQMSCQALNAIDGSILLYEPNTQELTFALVLNDTTQHLEGHRLAPGQGIAGWVAQHNQAVRINNVYQDPRFYVGIDQASGFETRSLMCAPLSYRDKITGVIEIINKRDGEFDDEDLRLLEAVSPIAAMAVENAHLYTTTRERADELALLNEIGLALTSKLDYAEVVDAALHYIRVLFPTTGTALLKADAGTGELVFSRALIRGKLVEIPVRLLPGEGIARWLVENRIPVLIQDAEEDPYFCHCIDEYLGLQTRSFMAVPLRAPTHNIGVLVVVHTEPNVYSSDNLRSLNAIVSTLAVALENARLYEEREAMLRARKETQAQLIHSEKMSALGRLVASIAHEINNPIQAIQGCLTLTTEELDGQQRRGKLDHYLQVVQDEIDRIADIVLRTREFYRPRQSGVMPADLHPVLDSVLELTNKQLQHSAVAVKRAWANDLPVIPVNTNHLRQVFLNLILNAVDAMPQGGTLYIETGLDEMDVSDSRATPTGLKAPAVRITFSDTGEGMTPETMTNLFEPFFTTKENGSGLGLSISYGIIQAHGGRISAASRVGEGTTFTILLPVEHNSPTD